MPQNLSARIDITAGVAGIDTVRKLREEITKLSAAMDKANGAADLTAKIEKLKAASGKINFSQLLKDLKALSPQLATLDGKLAAVTATAGDGTKAIKALTAAYKSLGAAAAAVKTNPIVVPKVATPSAPAGTAAPKSGGTYDPENRSVVLAQMKAKVENNRRNLNELDKLYADQYKAEATAAANLRTLRAQTAAQLKADNANALRDARAAAKAQADIAKAAAKAKADAAKAQAAPTYDPNNRSVVLAQMRAQADNNRMKLNDWDKLYADQYKAEAAAAANLKALRAQTAAQLKADNANAVRDARATAKAQADAAKAAAKAQADAAKAAAKAQADAAKAAAKAQADAAKAAARAQAQAQADAARNQARINTDAKNGLTGLAMAGVGAGYVARNQIKDTVQAGISVQGTKASLLAATGDADRAEAAFKKLLDITNRWGISLDGVKDAYPKMLLAADTAGKALGKTTEQTTEAANHVFEAIAKTSSALHLNKEQVNGVTKAFEQMLSKGTVSAEELRNQLGDRLAGTMPMAAKAIDKKVSELDELLRKKMISSYQFTIRLAEEMNKQFDAAAKTAAGQMQATFNKLQNDLMVARYNIGEAGLFDGLTRAANVLRDAFNDQETMDGLKALGASVGDLAEKVAQLTVAFAKFYGQHSEGINTIVKWAAAILGGAVAVKSITWLLGDAIKVAMKFGSVLWGAVEAITGVGLAATATAGGVSRLLGVMGAFGALAGGLYAVSKQVIDGEEFKAQVAAYNSVEQLNPEQLAGKYSNIDALQAERAKQQALLDNAKRSDVMKANDAMAGSWLGKKFGLTDNKAAKDEIQTRINNIDAAILKNREAEFGSMVVAAVIPAGEDPKKKAVLAQADGVLQPPKVKGGKGSNTNTESPVTAAAISYNKQVMAAERANLDYQLQQMAISFDEYAQKIKESKASEMALDKAQLLTERAKAKTPEQREVIDYKLKSLQFAYEQEAAMQDKQLAENKQKLIDNEKEMSIELLRLKNDEASAANAELEQQYGKLRDWLLKNGRKDGAELVKSIWNIKEAKNNIEEIKRQIATISAQSELKDAGIKLELANGSLTTYQADAKSVELLKERAALQLRLLEAVDMTTMSEEEQARHLTEILKLKADLLTKSQAQQQIEDDISQGMAKVWTDITTGATNARQAMTNFFNSITAALNKLAADAIAQKIKSSLFGPESSNTWLGQSANWAVGATMNFLGLTGGGSTPAAAVPNNMAAFNSVGDSLMNVGGQSYMNVNQTWNVVAPEGNQFDVRETLRQAGMHAKSLLG